MILDGDFLGAEDAVNNPHPSPICCNNNGLLYILFSPHFPPPVLRLPNHKLNDGAI